MDAAEVSIDDTVIEIGPGTGNITAVLLERAGKIVAVEKNPKYRSVLNGRFGNDPKLDIVIDNALYFWFPPHDRIVSNLPYSISEALFHRLFKMNFKSAAFIVPQGFARKINSETPTSKLSYLSNLMYHTCYIADVHPEVYLPTPRTPTAIVTIKHKAPEGTGEAVLQAMFRQEDKKTRNALREAFLQTGQAETKRLSRQIITNLNIPETLLGTPVGRLSFDQVLILNSLLIA